MLDSTFLFLVKACAREQRIKGRAEIFAACGGEAGEGLSYSQL